jgi:hypothetical protein
MLLTMTDGLLIYINEFSWSSIYTKLFIAFYVYLIFVTISVFDLLFFHINITLHKGITTVEYKEDGGNTRQGNCRENCLESIGDGCSICPVKSKIKNGGYLFEPIKEENK